MSYQPRLRFEQRGITGGVVFDGDHSIAEIQALRLYNVLFKPSRERRVWPAISRTGSGGGGQSSRIIGTSVPLPLYWEQYANHQHPERNAGSHGRLECVSDSESRISLKIESASHSREVESRYLVDLSYSERLDSFVFDVRCRLDIPEGKQWRVTHNPSHGELEFCNLWGPIR